MSQETGQRKNIYQRRNYQRELEALLSAQKREGRRPSLLLHSCCAPCSSYVLEYLSGYFRILDFYYNPNISPQEEHDRRARELERLIGDMPGMEDVTFVRGPYDPESFYDMARGMEDLPEGAERCMGCYRLRLEEAAGEAAARGCDYFATTLTISPMKNAEKINLLGEEIGERYGVSYLSSDFKKKNGFHRSTELSRIYDLYRQDYCGCIFSRRDRDRREA